MWGCFKLLSTLLARIGGGSLGALSLTTRGAPDNEHAVSMGLVDPPVLAPEPLEAFSRSRGPRSVVSPLEERTASLETTLPLRDVRFLQGECSSSRGPLEGLLLSHLWLCLRKGTACV